MITFSCPHCGEGLEAPESLRDQGILCPRCGHSVLVDGKNPVIFPHRKLNRMKWPIIASVAMLGVLVIVRYYFARFYSSQIDSPRSQVTSPDEKTPNQKDAFAQPIQIISSISQTKKLIPYKEILTDRLLVTSANQMIYVVATTNAALELVNNERVELETQATIDENRPRFAEEAVVEFQNWVSGEMKDDKGNPLIEAQLIKNNVSSFETLIWNVGTSRYTNFDSSDVPDSGFLAAEIVRIGVKNDQLVLIVGPLGSETIYNTLQSTEKERAGIVLKDDVFSYLQHVHACGKDIGAKFAGIVFTYFSQDFSEESAVPNVDVLGFVFSLDDCQQFSQQDISQEEFIRRSEIFLLANSNIKKIELTLE